MKKRADSLKVLAAAMVLGVLANTAPPAHAKDRDMAESTRVTAFTIATLRPINSILSLNSQTSSRCTQRA